MEETRLQDNLDRDEQEVLMIESWVEELESAREKIAGLMDFATTETQVDPTVAVFEESHDPVPEQEVSVPEIGAECKKVKARGRKGGLYRRFVH